MTEKDLDIAIEKCERIMEMDTRTMQSPVSDNGHIFEKVYELLKFLRQLQFATDTNVGGTNDTISRQTVLDAVDGVTWHHQNKHGEMVSGADDDEHQAWYKVEDIYKAIEALPSAQPDAVTASLEELINDYGEDGFFIIDGVNYQANELLNELKNNSSVGEKFRKQITKTIVQYFMKFGG